MLMESTAPGSLCLSSVYLNVASDMQTENKGISRNAVVVYKSYIPYSSVESAEVYKGTNKKDSILLEKLLIVISPIFFSKYLYLFIASPRQSSLYSLQVYTQVLWCTKIDTVLHHS